MIITFSVQNIDPTPANLYSGSRDEPTASTAFTSGNLPATLTCDSTATFATADTEFRATRTFKFTNLVDNFYSHLGTGLGSPYSQATLTLSNLQ